MHEWSAFLAWRRGAAPLTTERAFVDMLEGNLGAAHMLSRLMDLAAGRGSGPAPVQWKGRPWWALSWAWWSAELGLKERTGRRHAALLSRHGLVQTTRLSRRGLDTFSGTTLLWTVCPDVVMRQWYVWTAVQTNPSGISWGEPLKPLAHPVLTPAKMAGEGRYAKQRSANRGT